MISESTNERLEQSKAIEATLAQTLDVPFYKRTDWKEAMENGPRRWTDLPRLTKAELRQHSPQDLLPQRFNLENLVAQGIIQEERTPGCPLHPFDAGD